MEKQLFESAVVKELMRQCATIGEVHVKASPFDAASVVADHYFREQLKSALQAASADIGHVKAMKKAVKAARDAVEAHGLHAGLAVGRRSALQETVEAALQDMLSP